MKTLRPNYPTRLLCRILSISRSSFYARQTRMPSNRSQANERLKLAIKVCHTRTRETYGARRLQAELVADGFVAGRDRIAHLRKEMGIFCKQKRQFKATTDSSHQHTVAENLLDQVFKPTAPNQMWVTDITYLRTEQGWLYLAGVKDIYTCELVGYAMDKRMTKDLTSRALWSAVAHKKPPKGLPHQSDRGSQYGAHSYRTLLDQFGMKASMSRKGNCYDNAPMESFWGSLKNELVHHQRYATREEAEVSVREYIEGRSQGSSATLGLMD